MLKLIFFFYQVVARRCPKQRRSRSRACKGCRGRHAVEDHPSLGGELLPKSSAGWAPGRWAPPLPKLRAKPGPDRRPASRSLHKASEKEKLVSSTISCHPPMHSAFAVCLCAGGAAPSYRLSPTQAVGSPACPAHSPALRSRGVPLSPHTHTVAILLLQDLSLSLSILQRLNQSRHDIFHLLNVSDGSLRTHQLQTDCRKAS